MSNEDVSVATINEFEKKVYSQNGEDGIIEALFSWIGVIDKFYVEFGVGSGAECNSRLLRSQGWKGLQFDADHEDAEGGLYKRLITVKNIDRVFRNFEVPRVLDFLSIDVDGLDFYLWKALRYSKPRVVVIEFNGSIPPEEDKVVPYNPKFSWDGTNYFGASILAMLRLGRHIGYSLVGSDLNGVNLFFVADEEIVKLPEQVILEANLASVLYNPLVYGLVPSDLDRFWCESESLLKRR